MPKSKRSAVVSQQQQPDAGTVPDPVPVKALEQPPTIRDEERELVAEIEKDGARLVLEFDFPKMAMAIDSHGQCVAYRCMCSHVDSEKLSLSDAVKFYWFGSWFAENSGTGQGYSHFMGLIADHLGAGSADRKPEAASDWLRQGAAALAGAPGEVQMDISLPLSFREWSILLEGAAKNRVTVGEAVAHLVKHGQDSIQWMDDGFPMSGARSQVQEG